VDEFRKFWDEGTLVDQVSDHHFFHDILSGALKQEIFLHYLNLEFDFVKTAAQGKAA
tara:strand:- start:6144 stop:6314 length:171 start_codon:yes stop_codon:yes gene_type:complete